MTSWPIVGFSSSPTSVGPPTINSLSLSFGMDIGQYKAVGERKKEPAALEEEF